MDNIQLGKVYVIPNGISKTIYACTGISHCGTYGIFYTKNKFGSATRPVEERHILKKLRLAKPLAQVLYGS